MEKHDNSKTQGILSQDSQHMFIHLLIEKYDNSKTQALITRVNILKVTIYNYISFKIYNYHEYYAIL